MLGSVNQPVEFSYLTTEAHYCTKKSMISTLKDKLFPLSLAENPLVSALLNFVFWPISKFSCVRVCIGDMMAAIERLSNDPLNVVVSLNFTHDV